MALSIGVLGPLVIERDDCRLGKVPKKARALGHLAAQGGQAVSRERLADLLWPYQGSEQARHSLRNCLLELRKALEPSGARHLVADFANCGIQDVVVDLDRFEHLSRSRDRPEAAGRRRAVPRRIPGRFRYRFGSPFRNGWRPSATARLP